MFSAILIDAQAIIRSAVTMLLKKNGFGTIIEAGNGIEGLRLVKVYRPDLIIMDVDFIGISGVEVIKEIKKIDSAVRILVLTLSPLLVFHERNDIAGVYGVLSKGCSIDEFESMVNELRKL